MTVISLWREFGKQHVSVFVRCLSLIIGVMLIIIGSDPLLHPEAFHAPIYDVVNIIAPIRSWGAVFIIAGLIYVVAGVSSRFWTYLCGLLLGLSVQVAWFVGVMYARFVEDADFTSVEIGFQIGTLVLVIGTAMSPHQLQTPTVSVVLPEDNVVPIGDRRAS